MGLCQSGDNDERNPNGPLSADEAKAKIGADLRTKYADAGQGHVFQFADEGKLTKKQLDELMAQLQDLDLDRIAQVYNDAMEHDANCSAPDRQPGCCAAQASPVDDLQPLDPSICGNASAPDFDTSGYSSKGLEAISKGEVAALVLAGGAGTRLGFDSPKGMFSIGLPSGRSLFELFAQRLLKVSQLAGAENLIPWYVMTSEGDNHAKTVQFFKDNNYFGYVDSKKAPQVSFFSQGTLPCLTDDGKIMLETGFKVGVAADGNGGIYKALQKTGQIAAMRAGGVKYVHCFSVDNAIGKVWMVINIIEGVVKRCVLPICRWQILFSWGTVSKRAATWVTRWCGKQNPGRRSVWWERRATSSL
jgi:UDP-N-acetylglucosamine/UDP-N-acetylgalactosamine diphosphorylase